VKNTPHKCHLSLCTEWWFPQIYSRLESICQIT